MEPDPWIFTDVNEMLKDEFTRSISEPYIFCLHVDLLTADCRAIEKQHPKNFHRQVIDILNMWHEKFGILDKHKIFNALMSSDNEKFAREFADRHNLEHLKNVVLQKG